MPILASGRPVGADGDLLWRRCAAAAMLDAFEALGLELHTGTVCLLLWLGQLAHGRRRCEIGAPSGALCDQPAIDYGAAWPSPARGDRGHHRVGSAAESFLQEWKTSAAGSRRGLSRRRFLSF